MFLFIVETALQNRFILPVVLDQFMHRSRSALSSSPSPWPFSLLVSQINSADSSHSSCDCKALAATALFPNAWSCFSLLCGWTLVSSLVFIEPMEKCSGYGTMFWPSKTQEALTSPVTYLRGQTTQPGSIRLLILQWKNFDWWKLGDRKEAVDIRLPFFSLADF